MKNTFLSILLFLSITVTAQPYRYGSEAYYSMYRSSTDTAAWLSQLRQYEPKITTSLTSRYLRGDKTWQDFNAATLAATLSGFSLNNTAITASDNIVRAFGKAQQQINFREFYVSEGTTGQYYRGDKSWQTLDKSAVGLANVLNVAQEPAFASGTIGQYYRGDKSWQTLDKSAVGLANVLNVAQEPAFASGTTGQYYRGDKTWQTLDKSAVGLANVLNMAQEPAFAPGTTSQYYRGDKSWQTLDKTAVGLANVLNVTQEPALGNPSVSGYVLSSTTGGVRSWVPVLSGDFIPRWSGGVDQNTTFTTGIYRGLSALTAGSDDYTTLIVNNPMLGGGFQLQSHEAINLTDNTQQFYMRGRVGSSPYNWLAWKRLLTDQDLTDINNSISTGTGTFQGSLSNTQAGFTINDYTLRRQGNVVALTIRFSNTSNASPSADYYLCDIPVGYRPTSTTYGASAIEWATDYEGGFIKANTNGSISVRCGKVNKTYVANLTWIILNP